MECALALNFTGRGVPYLYCGHEFGDTTRHSILGNRFCSPNLRVNWSFAQTEAGQARMALIRAGRFAARTARLFCGRGR